MTLKTDKIFPRDGKQSGAYGGIIQLVRATSVTQYSITSNSDTTIISATITPRSASNVIFVQFNCPTARTTTTGNTRSRLTHKLLRGSTEVESWHECPQWRGANFNSSNVELTIPIFLDFLDTPATTSATTYNWQWASHDSETWNQGGGSTPYSLTLTEFSG